MYRIILNCTKRPAAGYPATNRLPCAKGGGAANAVTEGLFRFYFFATYNPSPALRELPLHKGALKLKLFIPPPQMVVYFR